MPSELSTNDAIAALHQAVDAAVAPLESLHRDRLQCRRGCAACCIDDITVFEVEAARIQEHHGDLLREGKAGPVGGCAFLDEQGACRIYAVRPATVRTGEPITVQGGGFCTGVGCASVSAHGGDQRRRTF